MIGIAIRTWREIEEFFEMIHQTKIAESEGDSPVPISSGVLLQLYLTQKYYDPYVPILSPAIYRDPFAIVFFRNTSFGRFCVVN